MNAAARACLIEARGALADVVSDLCLAALLVLGFVAIELHDGWQAVKERVFEEE